MIRDFTNEMVKALEGFKFKQMVDFLEQADVVIDYNPTQISDLEKNLLESGHLVWRYHADNGYAHYFIDAEKNFTNQLMMASVMES